MASASLSILGEPRVQGFVSAERVAHLATVNEKGTPHNVPLCFWFDGVRFYFVIDEKPKLKRGMELKRMRNIASNPRVCLLIDQYEEDWSQLAYVMVRGLASVVEDRAEHMLALRGLRDKYPQYRAMALSRGENPIVRIDPEHVHVWGARFQVAAPK
jgi:PPOX class probable F420-dependent enzyme